MSESELSAILKIRKDNWLPKGITALIWVVFSGENQLLQDAAGKDDVLRGIFEFSE